MGVAVGGITYESLILKPANNSRQRIVVRTRIRITLVYLLDKQRAFVPKKGHDFFFFGGETGHNNNYELRITNYEILKGQR